MGLFSKKSVPPPQGAVVLAPNAVAARQLDLADGVKDGKYFGAPIQQRPPPRAGHAEGNETRYPVPYEYPAGQFAETVYSRSIPEVEWLVGSNYSRGPSPASYGFGGYPATAYPPRAADPGFWDATLNPQTRSIPEIGWPVGRNYSQGPSPDGYGGYPATAYPPRPAVAGFWDVSLNPQTFGGGFFPFDYVVHKPGCTGYSGLPPQNSYDAVYPPTIVSQQPLTYLAPPQYSNSGAYPSSYPQPSWHQEQYNGLRGDTPFSQPLRYIPPTLAPLSDIPPSYTDPWTVPPPDAYDPNLRPWFGVALKWLDDLDLGGRKNVAVVHEVVPDSPAWKAGIQAKDQLEYWDNTKIDCEPVWKSKMSQIQIGDVINMGIHRNYQDLRVLVRIEGTSRAPGPRRMASP